MKTRDSISGLINRTSTGPATAFARGGTLAALCLSLAHPAVAQDDDGSSVEVEPATTTEEVQELANYEITPGNPQSIVVAEIGRSTREGPGAEIAGDVTVQESESLWNRLDQTPSDAVEGIPFGEYIAGDVEARRANALRSGPLSTEQLNYYKDLARLMRDTDPEAAEAALNYYRTVEFELHQDYWVDTGNPEVPETGNVLPVAAVVVDEAVEEVTD